MATKTDVDALSALTSRPRNIISTSKLQSSKLMKVEAAQNRTALALIFFSQIILMIKPADHKL